MAGSGRSLALLAAVCLAVGSVAYSLAASEETAGVPPAALTWGAIAFAAAAAALSGIAWLAWQRAGAYARGASLALLVVLAGGVLIVLALSLLSGSSPYK